MTASEVTLHIVYGIPCAGKSTTAVQFAHYRDISTVVNTDYLREVQRAFVSTETAPALVKVTHTAWELHGPPTRSNVEKGFLDHVNEVAPAIRAVTSKLVTDGFDAVMEGVHFHGRIIEELRAANPSSEIRATLLVVKNAEELRQRVSDKEQRRAQGAPRKLWKQHIPIMLTIQQFLISDAHAHGVHVTTADEWRTSWTPAGAHCSTSTTS